MKFFRIIKSKYNALLIPFLIRLGCFLQSPFFGALALWLVTTKLNSHGEYTVLCIGRSVFLHDVKAMAHFSGRIQYKVISKRYFDSIFESFVPDVAREGLEEINYHDHQSSSNGRQNYFVYMHRLLPILQKMLGFDALLSGNVGYISQQEIERACKNSEIPFIVIHKEGLDAHGYEFAYKTKKFQGAQVLFGNENIRRALLKLPMKGLTEEITQVVGAPRFDFYINAPKKNQTDKKQVVCFSFYPSDRMIQLIQDPDELEKAKEKYEEAHKMIMDFALRNADTRVIIKTKASRHFLEYVEEILSKNYDHPIKNLTITNSGDPFEYIRDSLAVISFNSTTLIEGVAFGKMIIAPDLRGLTQDESWDIFKDHPKLIHYAQSVEAIEQYISQTAQYAHQYPEERKTFLQGLIFTPDGKASQRTEEAIIQTIYYEKKNRKSHTPKF